MSVFSAQLSSSLDFSCGASEPRSWVVAVRARSCESGGGRSFPYPAPRCYAHQLSTTAQTAPIGSIDERQGCQAQSTPRPTLGVES